MKKAALVLCVLIAHDISAQTLKWARNFGYANNVNQGLGVAADKANNIITTGLLIGKVNFNPGGAADTLTSVGYYDMFMTKYDPNGNLIWAFSVRAPNDSTTSYGLTVDTLCNIYVCGAFTGTVDFDPGAANHSLSAVSNNSDIFIAKYDSSGHFLWAFNMGGNKVGNLNTNSNQGTTVTTDGASVYVTGYFQGTADFDPGPGTHMLSALGLVDTWVAKYDLNGNYRWAFNIGGPGGVSESNGQGISVDKTGNVFVSGYFGGTADFNPGTQQDTLRAKGYIDIFLAKYDSLGSYLWAFNVGSPGSIAYSQALSMVCDSMGNVYTTGFFAGSADFDPDTSSSHVLTSVYSTEADIYLAKYSSSGNYIWAFSLGATGTHQNFGFALATDGVNLFTCGRFSGTIDFDPGPGIRKISALGSYDIYEASYDLNGNYNWAFNIGKTGSNVGYAIAADHVGNLITTGWFSGNNNDFDPNIGIDYLNAIGSADVFLAKYGCQATNVSEISTDEHLIMYPNPTTRFVSIESSQKIISVVVYDALGNRIMNMPSYKLGQSIEFKAPGMYLVAINFETGTETRRIIVLNEK